MLRPYFLSAWGPPTEKPFWQVTLPQPKIGAYRLVFTDLAVDTEAIQLGFAVR